MNIKELRKINRLRQLITRNLTQINFNLSYDRITDTVIKLANAIHDAETDETTWSLGEGDAFSLDSLIVGAYWHYTEWHSGQNSKGYHALSVLGGIFAPGMSYIDPESSEHEAYSALNDIAEQDALAQERQA